MATKKPELIIPEPRVVERAAQPYVAIRRQVNIPFGTVATKTMKQVQKAIKAQEIQGTGAAIFKYNIVVMPALEIEFGFETATLQETSGELIAGTLPAGRYAELEYTGPYSRLYKVNGTLIDWSRAQGLEFDMHTEPDGDHFASRVEFYPNGPEDEPDRNKLITIVSIRLKD